MTHSVPHMDSEIFVGKMQWQMCMRPFKCTLLNAVKVHARQYQFKKGLQ
jgi:hypothetical protein